MWDTRDNTGLRPRGKGRKLAWQGALHENTMMLRMRMLPNLLPVATGRPCPRGGLERQPNCLCFMRLEIPPPLHFAKARGTSASFLELQQKGNTYSHSTLTTTGNTSQHQATPGKMQHQSNYLQAAHCKWHATHIITCRVDIPDLANAGHHSTIVPSSTPKSHCKDQSFMTVMLCGGCFGTLGRIFYLHVHCHFWLL